MEFIRCPIPQDDPIMNLPLDTDRTRGDNPVRNPLELTGLTGPGPVRLLQREVSTVAEVGRAKIVLTEPSRCQATDGEVEGTITDTRASIPYRCCDCGIRITTDHNSVMTEDKDKQPRPIRTYPVKTECAPMKGETVLLRPMNFLDVPALRWPGVVLKLAEEARNSEVMDDQQSGMSAVKLHRSGQAGRVMITEIIDSFPVLGSGASRASRTSTEVIPDLNLVEPVIRLGPVGHLRNTEQPMMLRVKTNQGTISPPGPVGQHVLMAGHMEMMVQRDPVDPYEETEPSVSQGMISPPGPVGQHVLMAGHMEMMVQPDPVVPYEETEPSVSPGLDAGQVEQLPSSQVLPGVEMSHIQPVADGPAGPVRTRHPAGTVMPPVIQDGVRLLAGGPVGQFPDPRFHISSKDSSPDNSYQPLVMGPSGANMSDASYDVGPRLVGDPLDRSTSVDPMGPREMLTLGDGIPPASMGPVGRPLMKGQLMKGQLMTGQLMRQTQEPDWKWSDPPRSVSDCDAESLHSVIRTEEEVYTGSVNTNVATGRAEPSEALVLSDSVIFSPGAQIHRIEEGSESATVKPDLTIRTGGEGRTDDVNFDTNNGQSGSSVVSPSSDSGVHSLDVGQHVLMAGHMEMMVQPDPVVPYEETEPSVSPGLDAGQVEQLPSSQVLPGVEMSHIQPVADGPAGPVRTRHPAGTVMPPVIQDGVRLLAGGPVGQFPDPRFHISSKDSSPDNSYQPLVMGPSGANMSDASYDVGPRLVGDPLDRSTSVDPMGPREMLTLGDGIPPASMGPVGRPLMKGQLMKGQLMTGQLMRQTQEPDWKWSDPPRSVSDCDAESLHSVIRTEEEVYTGSVNTNVATGRAEPSEALVLSDSVIFSPGAQIHRIEEGSESATVKPDLTIRTGGEGRTDDVNFDTNNGQSGSSVVSPSSDSGVHSLDEHWECMSTVSGDSDSIQSIITVYDGVVCEADSPPVRIRNVRTRGIVSSRGGTYGKDDSMSDLSSNGRNSDIAAMSDFSEEEDEAWEEVGPCGDEQPNIRTNCVGEDTIDSGEHSVLPATPTAVTHNVMEQHDEEYWTNFRLLAKQAFKLDDVKLAASSYPDAVKELVVRSRLTIENYPSTDDDSDSDSDTDTSYYECPLKIEYKDGWQYNTYTDGLDKKYYTKAEGHGLTLEMEIEDKMDVCSEPDTRAKFELSPNQIDVCPDPDDRAKFELSPDKIDVCSEPDTRAKFGLSTNKIDVCPDPDDRAKFELSPTKHVVELDNIRVKCITDGDVTVIRENVAGDSDAHGDEYIGLSMISVDETRKDTSVDVHNSLGTRECVIPECVTQPTLVAYGDSALCNKESLQIMRKYCFGLCGSTNQFHSTDFEWCVECVNRLIWGFLVWFLLS